MIKNAASAATKTLAATPMYPFGVYLMGRRVESDKFGASDRVDDNGNLADRRSEYTRVLGTKMDWHENANAPKVLEPFSRDILFSYPGSNIILQDDTRELFEEYYKTGVEAGTDYPTEHGKVAKRLDTFKFDFLKRNKVITEEEFKAGLAKIETHKSAVTKIVDDRKKELEKSGTRPTKA